MNKFKMFIAMIVAIVCFSAGNLFAQHDVKTMRLAVIWNPGTRSADAPWGWNVGGNAETPLLGDWNTTTPDKWMSWFSGAEDAPEIAKAQLKFFLSSLNPDITITSSLDDSGIPESGNAASVGLQNVWIYRIGDNTTYQQIKRNFGGDTANINAVVYIGAGASVPSQNRASFFTMLREAAKDNVGIFFIGQNSVIDARDLDTERTTFPIQGVQSPFTFQANGAGRYNDLFGNPMGALVSEFSFLESTNEWRCPTHGRPASRQGDCCQFWEIADTILVSGNDGNYQIHLTRMRDDGRRERGDRIYHNGTWQAGFEFVNPRPIILHKYGNWSITGNAVEVIGVDQNDPEMNYGFHREKSVNVGLLIANTHGRPSGTIGTPGIIGDVYITLESPSLFINGRVFLPAGTNLSKHFPGNPVIMDGNLVAENWFVDAPNPETGGNDRVLVLRKGQYIDEIRNVSADAWHSGSFNAPGEPLWVEYSKGTRIYYNAGGLRDLRISLTNRDSRIFQSIFISPELNGVEELKFKPYGSSAGNNGRIQAGASIWGFNKHLDLRSFSELVRGTPFNPKVHYVDFLGEQMAGRPRTAVATATTDGWGQFVRPPFIEDDFDQSRNFFRESELPAEAPGQHADYYETFRKKRFQQIGVVQHGRQRMAIMGFQPTFVENENGRMQAVLRDITRWIGFDNYSLPRPHVTTGSHENSPVGNGTFVGTDEMVYVYINASELSDDMREDVAPPLEGHHTLWAQIFWEGGNTAEKTLPIRHDADGRPHISFNLRDIISPDNVNITSIRVEGKMIPEPNSIYFGGEVSVTLRIRQLIVIPDIPGTDPDDFDCEKINRKPTDSRDTLIIRVSTNENGQQTDPNRVIVAIEGGETLVLTPGHEFFPAGTGTIKIPFDSLSQGELNITITAEKEGFVNSRPKCVWVNNNLDKCAPEVRNAQYRFGALINPDDGSRRPDTIIAVFGEEIFFTPGWTDRQNTARDVFLLWKGGNASNAHNVSVRVISVENIGTEWRWVFAVSGIQNGIEPENGDYIIVNPAAGLHDAIGNTIGDPNNPINDPNAECPNRPTRLHVGDREDVCAPVIVQAYYKFGDFKNINDPSEGRRPDTLSVTFNEWVTYDRSVSGVFWLHYQEGDSALIHVAVNEIRDNQRFWIFVVESIDGREPRKGDAININVGARMRDGHFNFVGGNDPKNECLDNPKIDIEVSPKPLSMSIWVFINSNPRDGEKDAFLRLITPTANNPILRNMRIEGKSSEGSLIIVDPGLQLTPDAGGKPEELDRLLNVVIIDPVGNKVVEAEYSDIFSTNERLRAEVVNAGDKRFLSIVWDNKNSMGRNVGDGAYMMLIQTRWVGNSDEFGRTAIIPVGTRK